MTKWYQGQEKENGNRENKMNNMTDKNGKYEGGMGKALGNLPTQKGKTNRKEADWVIRLEAWGGRKEIQESEYAYKKEKNYNKK